MRASNEPTIGKPAWREPCGTYQEGELMRGLCHADVQAPQETTLDLACCDSLDSYSPLTFPHINLVTHAHTYTNALQTRG